MNEDNLVARSLAHDLDAFNQLVIKYQNLAYQVAYHLLHDTDAATDAVHYSFVKAFGALESCEPGNFRNWLMKIITNTCCDLLHNRVHNRVHNQALGAVALKREETDESIQSLNLELPLHGIEGTEVMHQLMAGINSLPDEQRVALVLKDIHGFSYLEIAEICGIATGTVRTYISGARAKLCNDLVRDGYLPLCSASSPAVQWPFYLLSGSDN